MKKYFLSLVAMAAMLFATSCQESLVEPQLGGTTTFTVQVPDQMGTKALGSKANVNQLFVAVYADASADNAVAIYRDVVSISGGEATVSLDLVQGQRYDLVFWAQVDNNYVSAVQTDNEYTFDLVNIPMNKNYHNTDAGAAFFYYWDNFQPTGTSQPVTLRRPFAQLNLGTTDGSLTNNAGTFTLKSSVIKVKGIADNFNTVSGFGTVTEANKDQVYTFVAVEDSQVSIPLPSDVTIKVADVDYKYVSMDYLPIVGDDQALVTVKAEITLDNNQVVSHEFTNVPVRENYRTNIVGNLISSTTDFVVTIEEGFVDENNNPNPDNDYFVVDNVGDAEDVFEDGETHVAINYIVDGGDIDIPSTAAETLYLQLPDVNAEFTVNVPQQVKKLNIAVPNTNESNVGLNLIVNAPYSTVDFTGQAAMITSTTAPNTLNLNGAEVGTIIVKKGNVVIENDSAVGGIAPGEITPGVYVDASTITIYVDNSSDVDDIDSDFNKIEEPENINSLEALQNALTYSASDVIELSNAITNTNDFTLDLNGKTVTAVDDITGSYGLITNKANLTIVGPGTISLSATNDRDWNAYSSVISNNPGGNLTVGEDVVIEHLGGTDMAYGIDNLTNGKGTSAIATIDGATVKSTYRAIRQFLNGTEATNELYVKAGSTILNTTGTNKGIWMQDPSKDANTGKLVVEEGAHVDDVYLSVTAGSTEWPVEVSIASSSLNQGKTVMSSNVPAGYEVVEVGGVWKVIKSELWELVSTADELVAALEANKSVIFANDIEQVDGVLIKDKNITIDLNGKTFTVSEGASTSNRNFKIIGTSVVTIKNGTMIAQGELTSGAYGTIRTEGTAKVTLDNVKMYSYRGYGLNVKALTGTTVIINNSEIYSVYSGGVEAAGGTIELTNVKIDQKGVYSGAAWCSVAIGVNGGGKVVVNSGEYNAATIATDANAAQGTWVAYVMNSGGTLEINGGTFNATVAEIATAANACGLICVDANGELEIKGGEFNSTGAILDMRNNNSEANPQAVLYGGIFSADPTVSGLYSSNLIVVEDGYVVVKNENNGRWTVATLQEAFNNVSDGETIVLKRDITLSETAVLAEGKTAVLDLNGKTLQAPDMNVIRNDGGNLTIKNGTVTRTGDVVGYSVNNASGEIVIEDATIERGLYTSGSKMTATNANISHEQSSRHAIYAWNCEVTINSGTFHNDNAGNATLMASGSSIVTINGGTFSIADGRSTLTWTSSMIDQNSTAQVIIKGGLFNGGFRINSANTTLTIMGGEFNTNNGSGFTDYSGTKVVTGGKFTDEGAQNWAKKYIAEGYEMNANGEVVPK